VSGMLSGWIFLFGSRPIENRTPKTDRSEIRSTIPRSAARILPTVIIGFGLVKGGRSEGLLMGVPNRPSLAIPAYDGALDTLKTSIVAGMVGVDTLLGQIASRTTGHAGPVRNVPGSNPVDHDRTHFEGDYAIPIDTIRETDVDAFIMAICGVAEQYAAAMGATLLRTAEDITDATGNSIDAEGRPLSWDLILDAYEGTEIAFDDDGQPTTQLVMNPRTAMLLQAMEKTPEQERRYQEIMQRKKDEWDAQQRPRRLPRREHGAGA
jgi:hypothetical protein